jgi:hypothetical protein
MPPEFSSGFMSVDLALPPGVLQATHEMHRASMAALCKEGKPSRPDPADSGLDQQKSVPGCEGWEWDVHWPPSASKREMKVDGKKEQKSKR